MRLAAICGCVVLIKKINILFEFFNDCLVLARYHERQFGNIGDGGQGEGVSTFIFWNLKP